MKKLWLLAMGVVAVWSVVIAAGSFVNAQTNGTPVPFSADWVHYAAGEPVERGKYYVNPEATRLEQPVLMAEGADPVIITTISDFKKMIFYVLDASDRTYYTGRIQALQAGWDDFGKFGVPCPSYAQATRIGSDTLKGRATEKWSCEIPHQTEIAWFDTRLQRTIRIEYEGSDEHFEMINIKEGLQPESLFVPPPGYKRR